MNANAFDLFCCWVLALTICLIFMGAIDGKNKRLERKDKKNETCESLKQIQQDHEQNERWLEAVIIIDTQYNRGCEVKFN